MPRVLVMDARYRSSLAAIRNLGQHGMRVTAANSNPINAGFLSKHVDRRITYPDPKTNPDGFVSKIYKEIAKRKYDMILPVTDATVMPIVEQKNKFEHHTTVPFVNHDKLLIARDKARTIEVARERGIPHPETILEDDPDPELVDDIGYPVVLKPRRGHGSIGVTICESREEFERKYPALRDKHGNLLIQEFVPNGGEFGVYTLYDKSSHMAAVTVQRRIRSFPPRGGPSTLRETVRDDSAVSLANSFLSNIDWAGVAMVEFRTDAETGEPKLMEINPRLWGSLSLSIFAGVEFPYLLFQTAVNGAKPRKTEYRTGVQARWFVGDILHVLAADNKLRASRDFFRPSSKPRCYDIASIDDPLPFFGYLLTGASDLFDTDMRQTLLEKAGIASSSS